MKLLLPKSNASTILHVFILDSTSTAGAGKTGLAYNTASLVAKYIKPGGTLQAMTLEDITTLGTYAAPSSAAHLRFKLVDDTNAPGLYEIHLHADTLATNNSIVIMLFGATGMAPVVLEIQLSSINVNDGVRAGMTGIPNAVPGAENGIFIAGSNAATSITSSSGSALTITSSGGNGCGIIVAGNGSGSGIKSTGGTSGHGIEAILGGGMGTYAIQCNTGSINTASLIGNIVGTISAVASVGAGGIASTSFATGAITAAAIAADAIGASELAADAASEIGTAVWATAARTLTAATNITSTGGTTVPQTGDAYAIVNNGTYGNSALNTTLGTIAGYIDTEIGTIITNIAALHNITAADVVTALLGDTTILPAGTVTFAQIIKILAARAAGDVKDKVGGGYSVFSPDNGTTEVFSFVASATTPYLDVTLA